MLSASRGSNATLSDCYIEGSISLKTRSKAFLANCTIRFCTFDTQNQDRLQLQIQRLQQQPAILCDSAAQADVRAVNIVNYDTAISATHKDSKIHGISCQIHGCSDAAIEVMHRFVHFQCAFSTSSRLQEKPLQNSIFAVSRRQVVPRTCSRTRAPAS